MFFVTILISLPNVLSLYWPTYKMFFVTILISIPNVLCHSTDQLPKCSLSVYWSAYWIFLITVLTSFPDVLCHYTDQLIGCFFVLILISLPNVVTMLISLPNVLCHYIDQVTKCSLSLYWSAYRFLLLILTVYWMFLITIVTAYWMFLITNGRFSKAGLLEWMPFVIFRERSRERLQRTSGPISE